MSKNTFCTQLCYPTSNGLTHRVEKLVEELRRAVTDMDHCVAKGSDKASLSCGQQVRVAVQHQLDETL